MISSFHKKCSKCGTYKPHSDYYKSLKTKDGLRNSCKVCGDKWRLNNVEKVKNYSKAYYEKNKSKVLEKNQKWYRDNKTRHREMVDSWHSSHPEAIRAINARRRARIKSLEFSVNANQIITLMSMQKKKCAICRKPLNQYHVDHIEPISKGGGSDFYNLQILCPSCNCSKHDKDPILFMQERGFLL